MSKPPPAPDHADPGRPSRRFGPGIFVWLCVALAAIGGTVWRFDALAGWSRQPQPAPAVLEDATLYQGLSECGLLPVNADGTLELPAADRPLVELARAEAAGQPSPRRDPVWDHCARLNDLLHKTRNGAAVRHAIQRMNASLGVTAARDDRPLPDSDPGGPAGGPPAPVLIGDRPNRWTAAGADDRPVAPVDLFIPESFRFVSAAPRPGFGDWRAYTGARDGLRLETVLELEAPATVTIQAIGRLDPARSSLPAGAVIVPRCPTVLPARFVKGSALPCDPTTAPGAEIILPSLARGRHAVALWLASVAHDRLPIPDLPLVSPGPGHGRPEWRGVSHPPGREPPPPRAPVTLLSADGVPLWREDQTRSLKGRPTPEALAAGLLPPLGYGADDRQGLAGILAHRADTATPATVATTIDLRVQKAAQTALDAVLDTLFAADDPYRTLRRAAIVVVDPATGAILGLAGHPNATGGLHAWDYAAGRATDRRRDPLAVQGWQGRSAEHNPGSSDKPLTAMAGLRAAQEDPATAAMIAGCPLRGNTLPCADMNADQGFYRMPGQSEATHNFKPNNRDHDTVAGGFAKPHRDRACVPDAPPRSDRFGLPEAVRDSLNSWFIGLAQRLDHAAAAAYDAAARRRPNYEPESLPNLGRSLLVDTAALLGLFDDTLDLAGTARSRLGRGNPLDVLHPEPAQWDLRDLTDPETKAGRPRSGAVDALAMTAIGQRMQMLPIHIVRIAATIAGGRMVVPHLIGAWNGEPVAAPEAALFPAPLDPLRAGMKSVTEVGTAAKAFEANPALKAARCNVYGKTGTAEIRTGEPASGNKAMPHVNSAWFMGWADTPALTALAGPQGPRWTRPVAFACFISHVHGDARFGGATCAPAVAAMLQGLADPEAPLPLPRRKEART